MVANETSRAKLVKRLQAEGWSLARHGGEHDVYRHPTIAEVIYLPRHRTISPGVARIVAKAAGWLGPQGEA